MQIQPAEMFEDPPGIFNPDFPARPESVEEFHGTTRRSLFGLLALPFVRRPAGASNPLRVEAAPALESGGEPDPDAILTLEPTDPHAVELARLWDELRAYHEPETQAELASAIHLGKYKGTPKEARSDWREENDRLVTALSSIIDRRFSIHQLLISTIIEAHGKGNGNLPAFWQWYRVGQCHRIIRVADRLYTLTPVIGTSWPEDLHDEGDVNLAVIDLGSKGGPR